MPGTLYVALLRGINVGGNNLIPMTDLRTCFEVLGAKEVATYIQSGNVIFDGGDRPTTDWAATIETALAETFAYDARIVLVDHPTLRRVVDDAPDGFDRDPDDYRRDVAFLRGPSTAADVIEGLRARDGVDRFVAGQGVVYFERLASRASQSRLSKVASLPAYREMTIRNWRTTTTLLGMLDERLGDDITPLSSAET